MKNSEELQVLKLREASHSPPARKRNRLIVFVLVFSCLICLIYLSISSDRYTDSHKRSSLIPIHSKAVSPPILITNFTVLRQNALGFAQDTDGTMPTYALVPGGVRMIANTASYWYSNLVASSTSTCFSTTATHLRISAKGLNSTNGRLNIGLAYSTAATGCARSKISAFTITRWIIDPATGDEIGEITLSTLVGLDKIRLRDIAINAQIFPQGIPFIIKYVSFAFEPYFGVPATTNTVGVSTTLGVTAGPSNTGFKCL